MDIRNKEQMDIIQLLFFKQIQEMTTNTANEMKNLVELSKELI